MLLVILKSRPWLRSVSTCTHRLDPSRTRPSRSIHSHASMSHASSIHAEVYQLQSPPLSPILVNSPHSGTLVPSSFSLSSSINRDLLTQTEDSFVDELWLEACQSEGAGLMCASFPRWFIDLNRREDDIDSTMIEQEDSSSSSETHQGLIISPGPKSKLGLGLIRKLAAPGVPIYDSLLTREDIKQRIEAFYRPYHRALHQQLEALHRDRGCYLLIDAHSMKSMGNSTTPDGAKARPDVVIGDRHGRSCASWVTSSLVESFKSHGLSVQVNDPYSGAHIMREYGRLIDGRHAIQIEVNRSLYMDEKTRIKSSQFPELQRTLVYCLKALKGEISGHGFL